jgi:hypothetical protein
LSETDLVSNKKEILRRTVENVIDSANVTNADCGITAPCLFFHTLTLVKTFALEPVPAALL